MSHHWLRYALLIVVVIALIVAAVFFVVIPYVNFVQEDTNQTKIKDERGDVSERNTAFASSATQNIADDSGAHAIYSTPKSAPAMEKYSDEGNGASHRSKHEFMSIYLGSLGDPIPTSHTSIVLAQYFLILNHRSGQFTVARDEIMEGFKKRKNKLLGAKLPAIPLGSLVKYTSFLDKGGRQTLRILSLNNGSLEVCDQSWEEMVHDLGGISIDTYSLDSTQSSQSLFERPASVMWRPISTPSCETTPFSSDREQSRYSRSVSRLEPKVMNFAALGRKIVYIQLHNQELACVIESDDQEVQIIQMDQKESVTGIHVLSDTGFMLIFEEYVCLFQEIRSEFEETLRFSSKTEVLDASVHNENLYVISKGGSVTKFNLGLKMRAQPVHWHHSDTGTISAHIIPGSCYASVMDHKNTIKVLDMVHQKVLHAGESKGSTHGLLDMNDSLYLLSSEGHMVVAAIEK